MSEKAHKNPAGLAQFFEGLCGSERFNEGFLEPLRFKAELMQKILIESNDPVEIYRAQGALKVIEDIYFWLGRHQEKLETIRLKQEKLYVRRTNRSNTTTQ